VRLPSNVQKRLNAEECGVLSDLKQLGIRHRVSLYADDVVIFAKP
jgi:hypothetical protein